MFFSAELQISGVGLSSQGQGLITPSNLLVCSRKIALHDENVFFWCDNAPQRRQLGLFYGQRVLVLF